MSLDLTARRCLGVAAAMALSTALIADPAFAAPPVPNKGDTSWMLISSALVLLMTVPGLALLLWTALCAARYERGGGAAAAGMPAESGQGPHGKGKSVPRVAPVAPRR